MAWTLCLSVTVPHIFIDVKNIYKIILIRAKSGIIFTEDQLVHVAFVFAGSSGERILHLTVLAAIAQITQNPEFKKKWLEAKYEEDLKNVILLAERMRG